MLMYFWNFLITYSSVLQHLHLISYRLKQSINMRVYFKMVIVKFQGLQSFAKYL